MGTDAAGNTTRVTISRRISAVLLLAAVLPLFSGCATTEEGPSPEEQLAESRAQNENLSREIAELEERLTDAREALAAANNDRAMISEQGQADSLLIAQLEAELAKNRETIRRLNEALSQASFAQQLFDSRETGNPNPDSSSGNQDGQNGDANGPESTGGNAGSQASGRDSETSDSQREIPDATVFSPEVIGRSAPQSVRGSALVSQEGRGMVYISHESAGHFSEDSGYLEIHQGRGTGTTIYLVLQVLRDRDEEAFGLYGADISLAGTFLISIGEAEYAERLIDPSTAVERLYFPLEPRTLQALGRMVIERRGKIIIKGLFGERELVMDAQRAERMQEVLSAFIEIGN